MVSSAYSTLRIIYTRVGGIHKGHSLPDGREMPLMAHYAGVSDGSWQSTRTADVRTVRTGCMNCAWRLQMREGARSWRVALISLRNNRNVPLQIRDTHETIGRH